jgi:hypothetical protein
VYPLLHARVVINPAQHGNWFAVFLELAIADLLIVMMREESSAVDLKLQVDFLGVSLDLDEQIGESLADSNNLLDSQFLVAEDYGSQKFLLTLGFSSQKRNSVGVELPLERFGSDVDKFLGTNRNETRLLEMFSGEEVVNGWDANRLLRLLPTWHP